MKHHERFVRFRLHWLHNPGKHSFSFMFSFSFKNHMFTLQLPPRFKNRVPENRCDRRQINVK